MFESIAVLRAEGRGVSKHAHRREERCIAVAGSGAQKPLAEVNCSSDDPFVLASRVKIHPAVSPSSTNVLPHLPFIGVRVKCVKAHLFFLYFRVGREGSKNKPLPFPSNLVCLALRLTAACSWLHSEMAVKARSEAALDTCLPLPPTLRKQPPSVVYIYYAS